MSGFEFLASIVDSVAWPIAVAVLIWRFRDSVAAIFQGLTRVKYGELEAEFQSTLSHAERVLVDVSSPRIEGDEREAADRSTAKPLQPRSLMEEVEAIAVISPSAAVVVAWSAIERALLYSVVRNRVSPDPPQYNSAVQNIEFLNRAKLIPDEVSDILNNLRMLRNKVAHPSLPSSDTNFETALRYGEMAVGIVEYLDSLGAASG